MLIATSDQTLYLIKVVLCRGIKQWEMASGKEDSFDEVYKETPTVSDDDSTDQDEGKFILACATL